MYPPTRRSAGTPLPPLPTIWSKSDSRCGIWELFPSGFFNSYRLAGSLRPCRDHPVLLAGAGNECVWVKFMGIGIFRDRHCLAVHTGPQHTDYWINKSGYVPHAIVDHGSRCGKLSRRSFNGQYLYKQFCAGLFADVGPARSYGVGLQYHLLLGGPGGQRRRPEQLWTSIWSFSTLPPLPGAPALSLRQNGAAKPADLSDPFLEYRECASTYTLQVATVSTFGTTVTTQSGLSTEPRRVSGHLAFNTQYFWEANATITSGPGPMVGSLEFHDHFRHSGAFFSFQRFIE